MFARVVCLLVVIAVVANCFHAGFRFRSGVARRLNYEVNGSASRAMFLSMSEGDSAPEATGGKQGDDIGKYSVGMTLNGELVSSKDFGIFVQIEGSKTRVLLPRSLLSRGEYAKLTNMTKQKATISFDIASVDTEKKTLSGTYNSGVEKKDLSSITDDDVKKTEYSATVVGTHDFGIFVELDGFGVDGLVPASMLPRGGNPKADYHAGDNVSVLINEMANEGKKMTLSLVGGSAGGGSSEGGSLDGTGFNKDQWMQGVVTSVSNFGLFVRPAGYDMVGLVHSRQIPRDLMASLKKQVDVSNPGDKTDVELLFQEGDVVSCRVNSFNGPKKLDMSMLPPKDEEETDDYVVDGRDPEEDGQEGGQRRRSSKWAEDNEDSQAVSAFNGEGKLLWWRGAPYTPLGRPGNDEDVEMAVITESDKVVEGVWRRMFEVDLREDAADFSSRVNEQELKELQSDIGELMGLDDDMFEMNDLTLMSRSPMTVGASAMGLMDQLPDDWKSELSFFKETSTTQSALDTMYKGGKAAEQSEFDALIREVEVEIQANKKSGEPEIEVAPEAISAEAAAPAAPAEAAAPEEAAADAEAPAEAEA